jgi:CubicO group peptidase (beta-lactamase class C family)
MSFLLFSETIGFLNIESFAWQSSPMPRSPFDLAHPRPPARGAGVGALAPTQSVLTFFIFADGQRPSQFESSHLIDAAVGTFRYNFGRVRCLFRVKICNRFDVLRLNRLLGILCAFALPLLNTGSEPAKQVDRLLDSIALGDAPGASVVIVRDRSIVYQRSLGYANLEHKIPIYSQTLFDGGSLAKQVTGLAVAILIDKGQLALDDDVRKYLTDLPDFGAPIRVRHLLYHCSGLRDWSPALVLAGESWTDITSGKIMAFVRRQRELESLPGETDLYCNTGYNLLAEIVAKVTGQPFSVWMNQNVFKPLQMNATRFLDRAPGVIPNQADSYIFHSEIGFVRSADRVFAPGSSSFWTTSDDMAKWLINFETAAVGGSNAMMLMQTKGGLTSGRTLDYGFGLVLDKFHDLDAVSHGGGWEGFVSAVLYIPAKHFGVAVLSNRGETNAERLTRQIAEIWLDLPPDSAPGKPMDQPSNVAPTPIRLAPEKLAIYGGDYWSEELQVVYHVEMSGDKLTLRYHFHDPIPLTPLGNHRFKTGLISEIEAEAQVVFTRGENEINEMNLSVRRVRKIKFNRISLPKR